MMVDWRVWKHAMARYAAAYDVRIPVGFTPSSDDCGKHCETLLKRIQHLAGLEADGVLGPQTAAHLGPFLALTPWRAKMLNTCQVALSQAPLWHYSQRRPIPHYWHSGTAIYIDCSASSTMIGEMAGARDPNGWGYNGTGNTTSIRAHLQAIPRAWAKTGDLIWWLGHVTILQQPGPDPLAFSHGFEGGPISIRASVEDRYHPGSPVYLRMHGLHE